MKIRFAYKFFLGFLALTALLSTASVFTGCAVFKEHSATVELIVSQAAMRYVEQAPAADRAARAARIVDIATQIEKAADSKSVSVNDLAALALAAIPSTLSPSDRALAVSVVSIAAQELRNKVGEQVLNADQLVSVVEVVDAIKNAASIYVSR